MNRGEKIAELRKKNGMTQDDLGKKMSVSYQAVSKWERDESQPDFETMSKIARLFNVPLSYFEDGGELTGTEAEEAKADATEAPKAEFTVAETAEPAAPEKRMLGTCTQCGRVVYEGDEATIEPKLVCKKCAERIRQAVLLQKQKEEEVRRKTEQYEQTKLQWKREELKRKRNRGLWIAAIPATLFLIVSTVSSFLPENDFGFTPVFFGGILTTLLIYCFTTQMIWGGIVRNVFLCGGYSIRLPGIIFSFSPDGIVFLILAKIFLALVAAFVFVGTSLICALAAVLISLFTFIPALISRNREIANVK